MERARGGGGDRDLATHIKKRYDVQPKDRSDRRTVSTAGPSGADGDEGDDSAGALSPLRPAVRKRTPRAALFVQDFVQEALVACIQRACGLPSSQPLVSRSTSVTARVIGDKNSRSRAIVLRSGVGKKDVAIMWVSCRDGLLCSCFGGTQNALFLSASARSTKCIHTVAMNKALAVSGVGIDVFRGRMRLRADAADFAVPDEYGVTILWAVLYRSVFSVVSFSSGNAPACIAPGCRRFRGRCGHVRVARDRQGPDGFLDASTGTVPVAVKARLHARKHAGAPRAKVLDNEEEDEGVEKEESDTIRGPQDPDQAKLSSRASRNLLPCSTECDQGEVWARTADWRALYMKRVSGPAAAKASDLKMHNQLFAFSMGAGHLRDVRDVLVEPCCGSCGQKREERHEVVKEPGLLTTHHPSAPSLKVCAAVFYAFMSELISTFCSCLFARDSLCGSASHAANALCARG